jgi:hypothetical protein
MAPGFSCTLPSGQPNWRDRSIRLSSDSRFSLSRPVGSTGLQGTGAVGGGGTGCLVDLEGSQEVGTLGSSTAMAPLLGDCPIKKRTRPGPLDDQISLY